jgi:hypothetical protein
VPELDAQAKDTLSSPTLHARSLASLFLAGAISSQAQMSKGVNDRIWILWIFFEMTIDYGV